MTTGLLAALYAVVLATAFAASRVRPLASAARQVAVGYHDRVDHLSESRRSP